MLVGCHSDKLFMDSGATLDDLAAASDVDRDGVPSSEDCDDEDAAAFPGATEVCDGVDNDCDGEVDEGLAFTAYADADGDGFGDPSSAVEVCALQADQVLDDTDCDDADPLIHPGLEDPCDGIDNDCDLLIDEDGDGQIWYLDLDGDGHGDLDSATTGCSEEPPEGFVALSDDCDDENDQIYPGAPERCDSLDNDCNGFIDDGVTTTWYRDLDGDGAGDSSVPLEGCDPTAGYVDNSADCDDTDPSISPWSPEVCNGIDDDCDGYADEADALDAGTWYADGDGDGFGDPDGLRTACVAPAGYTSVGGDCNDLDSAIHPDAAEVCNGVDDDCDALIDADDDDVSGTVSFFADSDGDGYGSEVVVVEACEAPSGYVLDDSDCDDLDSEVNPAAIEVCNGIDDDCDALVDAVDDGVADATTYYIDADGDGFGAITYTEISCDVPAGYVLDDTDCDDLDAGVNPEALEVCNGIDDDCDGDVSWQEEDPDGDGIPACLESLWLESSRTYHNDPTRSATYGSLEAAVLLSDYGVESESAELYSSTISSELLNGYGILVIYGQGYDGPLSADEQAALEEWVFDGGRLFYLGGWGGSSTCAMVSSLPDEFGIGCASSSYTWSGTSSLSSTHPVADGVSTIIGLGGELWTVSEPATTLATTSGWPTVVISEHGAGRIVGLSDEWPMYNRETSSSYDIGAQDNELLIDNIWGWLSEVEL